MKQPSIQSKAAADSDYSDGDSDSMSSETFKRKGGRRKSEVLGDFTSEEEPSDPECARLQASHAHGRRDQGWMLLSAILERRRGQAPGRAASAWPWGPPERSLSRFPRRRLARAPKRFAPKRAQIKPPNEIDAVVCALLVNFVQDCLLHQSH
jgi:hypothetical protein